MTSPNDDQSRSAARLALAIYQETLEAVRADALTLSALQLDGGHLLAGDVELSLAAFERVYVVGAGKAALGMVRAVEQRLGERIDAGVAVTKYGHGGITQRVALLEAGHPVPDEGSLAAGRAILDTVQRAGDRDLVIALISGGASALMELPEDGVALADLRELTAGLLRAGAAIDELNAVRACVSRLKAGGLARAAAPAQVVCLVLSDVLGSPLDVIASGPFCDRPRSPAAARAVLERHGLWLSAPASVQALLSRPYQPAAVSGPAARHVVIGDIWTGLRAAEGAARRRGLSPVVLTGCMEGEAREVARLLGGMARDLPRLKAAHGIDCLILGGETTVTVRGAGKGGRSQEIACVAADALAGVPEVALLAAGTDGTDGPTDAAGGLVVGSTRARAAEAGWTLSRALATSDSYAYLAAADALVTTGPTHSNVGDLVLVVTYPEDRP